MGDERFLTVRAGLPLPARLGVSLQVKAYHAGRNEYRRAATASTGVFVLYAVPGLRWKAPGGVGLYANTQVPVFQHVNENQLGVRLVTQLGLSRSF